MLSPEAQLPEEMDNENMVPNSGMRIVRRYQQTRRPLIQIQEEDYMNREPLPSPRPSFSTCGHKYDSESQCLTLDCRSLRDITTDSDLEKIPIKKIIVNCPYFDHKHVNLIKKLSFKELHFHRFHNTQWVRSKAVELGGRFKVSTNILREVINRENGQKLEHLTINGTYMVFEDSWGQNVAAIAKNLTHLSIPYLKLSTAQFQSICQSFTRLTYLNISDSNLRTLKGISKLQKLATLVFRDPIMKTHKEFSELSELPKLTMLDVSASPGKESTFAKTFAESGVVLQALESFICTRNPITGVCLDNILSTHDKLIKIGLLDIAKIGDFSDLKAHYNDVSFLSTETFGQCIDSYNFLQKCPESYAEEIYKKIIEKLRCNIHEKDMNDVHKCLHITVAVMMENRDCSYSAPYLLKGLYFLLHWADPKVITVDIKTYIINICVRTINTSYASRQTHELAWTILKPEFLEGAPVEPITEVCQAAIDWLVNDSNRMMRLKYVEILSKFINYIPENVSIAMANYVLLRDMLTRLIDDPHFIQNPNDMVQLVDLLSGIHSKCTHFQPSGLVLTAYRLLAKFCYLTGIEGLEEHGIPKYSENQIVDPLHDTEALQELILIGIYKILMRVTKSDIVEHHYYVTKYYASCIVNMLTCVLQQYNIHDEKWTTLLIPIFVHIHYINSSGFSELPNDQVQDFIIDFLPLLCDYEDNRHIPRLAALNEQIRIHGIILSTESWAEVLHGFADEWMERQRPDSPPS